MIRAMTVRTGEEFADAGYAGYAGSERAGRARTVKRWYMLLCMLLSLPETYRSRHAQTRTALFKSEQVTP
jgi:hypothetical protein